jgi:hypothetical protein
VRKPTLDESELRVYRHEMGRATKATGLRQKNRLLQPLDFGVDQRVTESSKWRTSFDPLLEVASKRGEKVNGY